MSRKRRSQEPSKQDLIEGFLLTFDLELLSEYEDEDNPIIVESKICGHSWESTYRTLIQDNTCPHCEDDRLYTLHKGSLAQRAIYRTVKARLKLEDLTGILSVDAVVNPEKRAELARQIDRIYNRAKIGYAVDYIIPVSWFNLLDRDTVEWCYHPQNLKIIRQEHLAEKSTKLSKPEFLDCLERRPKLVEILAYATTDEIPNWVVEFPFDLYRIY